MKNKANQKTTKAPNTACTRTAGFSPPNELFRDFGICPFRRRVSSRQPPVTRAVGRRENFRVLLSFKFSSITELPDRMFAKESFQSMPHTPRLVCNKVCFRFWRRGVCLWQGMSFARPQLRRYRLSSSCLVRSEHKPNRA
jgi:hypothetical protein